MEEVDRRAEENRQRIQIIDNKWCVCQNKKCAAHIKLLPQTEVISEHSVLHP
jgi:hypothetical protein